jgi:Zn-dependent protease
VLLFSLSVHESAHAFAALRLGDDTALREGRISLNPIVHIDPVGTLLLPMMMMFMSGQAAFGWAKPTPYNPGNFRRDVKLGWGHMVVAAAGPISNFMLALIFFAALFAGVRLGWIPRYEMSLPYAIVATGISLNIFLGLFNLVPLPPLDGSKVASWGLPRSLGDVYDRIVEPLGPIILLVLLVPVSMVLSPIESLLSRILIRLVM